MSNVTIITGASGGMGRACARLLGGSGDLILTDVVGDKLQQFTEELRNEGIVVRGSYAGDLADPTILQQITSDLDEGMPFHLVHTAGLSPVQAEWTTILSVNLIATELLLEALEPHLVPGSVAVLIASSAGHSMPVIQDVQNILDDALAPNLLERIQPSVFQMGKLSGEAGEAGVAYSLSKQAVIRLCQRRAMSWGRQGCRIVSISPGLIMTPMGRKELEEGHGAAESLKATPVGHAGSAMDIAFAAQFLLSDAARFITGTDLLVDGGVTGAARA